MNRMKLRLRFQAYSATSIGLRVCIGLLMVDALIELSFASSTTAWLKKMTIRKLHFIAYGSKHHIPMLPRHLVTGHLYTSNVAAVLAFALVGLGGLVVLFLRNWAQYRRGVLAKYCRYLYYFWLSVNMLALLFTSATMIYAFALTNGRTGQKIYVSKAADLDGSPYDLGNWTPEGWLSASLKLKLSRDRGEIERQLRVMKGGLYNLPPMFLFQSGVSLLGYIDYTHWALKPRMPQGFD